jgi:hypothetical protein
METPVVNGSFVVKFHTIHRSAAAAVRRVAGARFPPLLYKIITSSTPEPLRQVISICFD